MNKRLCVMTRFFLFLIIHLMLFTPSAAASSVATTIYAGNVAAARGEPIVVPIEISGNTGICAALITVTFDGITLVKVTQGEALNTLNMTSSIKKSTGSVAILWDGVSNDNSNGIVAFLTFESSNKNVSTDINIHCKSGNIKNEDLQNVNATFVSGSVLVQNNYLVKVTIMGKEAKLTAVNLTGRIIVAYYDESDKYLSMDMYSPDELNITPTPPENAFYAKVMWWDTDIPLKPNCAKETIYFN